MVLNMARRKAWFLVLLVTIPIALNLVGCQGMTPERKKEIADSVVTTTATILRIGMTVAQMGQILGAPDSSGVLRSRRIAAPGEQPVGPVADQIYRYGDYIVRSAKGTVISIVDNRSGEPLASINKSALMQRE